MYPNILVGFDEECSDCQCCTFCAKRCQCLPDLSTSQGILGTLNLDLPVNYEEVAKYIKQKIEEEIEESEATTEGSSTDEDLLSDQEAEEEHQ